MTQFKKIFKSFLFCIFGSCLILFAPVLAQAVPLDQALELRPGFTVNTLTPIVQAFDGNTSADYYKVKPFTGQPGDSILTARFVASHAGANNRFGTLDGNTFSKIIGAVEGIGTIATKIQGETELITLGFQSVTSYTTFLYSAIDSDNPKNGANVIAKIINKAGSITINSANNQAQSITFPVELGDVVVFLEDIPLHQSDKDWNDFVVILSQKEKNPAIYSISGTAFRADGSTPLSGVTVNLSDGKTTTTDASGFYSFNNLKNGSYSVTAGKNGYTFSSNPRNVAIANANLANVDFVASDEPRYSISGLVRFSDGGPVSGIAVSTTGANSISNSSGAYSLGGLFAGTYSVSGLGSGYIVSPENFTNPLNLTNSSLTDKNFVVTCALGYIRVQNQCLAAFTLSGSVTFSDNTPLSGVPVTGAASGGITNQSGLYSIPNVIDGSYSLTAALPGYIIVPSNFNNPVQVAGADKGNLNFVVSCALGFQQVNGQCLPVFALSGTVTFSDNAPVAGAAISGAGAGAVSTPNGSYSIAGITNGSYQLTAALAGYDIAPINFTNPVIVNGADRPNLNFLASCAAGFIRSNNQCLAVHSISGFVRLEDGTPLTGAIVTGGSASNGSGGNGAYILSNLTDGSYSLSASLAGYDIQPENFSNPVLINGSNLTNINFVARCGSGFVLTSGACVAKIPSVTIQASDGTEVDFVLVTLTKEAGLGVCDLYRSQNQGSRGSLIISGLAQNTYEDRGAVPGVTYYYSAECVQSGGGSPVSSNEDPGFRKAGDQDCDGDGVTDAQEVLDGTGVCDPGSFRTHLKSPVFTKYNTFLGQWNFLELISAGTSTLNATVTVYTINGEVIGTPQAFKLEPGQQFDVNVHDLVGQIDTYGLVKIDFNDKDPGAELLGRMSMYRPDRKGDTFSFAFARELRNATLGATYALANSLDPQGQGFLVPVWSEVTNVDTVARAFGYRVYSQDGKLLSDKTITLPPFGQFDVQAGHEFGEGVYLNEVVPLEGSAPYLAALSRYSSNHSSGAEAESYNFAFSTDARAGSGDSQFMAISNQAGACWNQTNWVEVGNVQDIAIDATLIFRDDSGSELGQSAMKIEPRSQFHFNGSALLPKGKRGSVQISGSAAGSLIAQSVVYYHDCEDNKTQSAFVSQGRMGGQIRQTGTFNTFLGMSNLLTIISTNANAFQAKITARALGIADIQQTVDLGGQQTFDTGIGAGLALATPSDAYGTVSIESPAGQKVAAENVRVRELNGKVDFAMATAVQ